MSQPPKTVLDLDQVRALASPLRQRMLDTLLGSGPRSIAELAEILDVGRSTLYYHIQRLLDVGLVEDLGKRPATTRRERTYGAVGGRKEIGSSDDPEYRAAVLSLYETHLRAISRQLSDSLDRDPTGLEHRLLRYRVPMDAEGFAEFMDLLVKMDEFYLRQIRKGEGRAHWVYLFQIPEGDE